MSNSTKRSRKTIADLKIMKIGRTLAIFRSSCISSKYRGAAKSLTCDESFREGDLRAIKSLSLLRSKIACLTLITASATINNFYRLVFKIAKSLWLILLTPTSHRFISISIAIANNRLNCVPGIV